MKIVAWELEEHDPRQVLADHLPGPVAVEVVKATRVLVVHRRRVDHVVQSRYRLTSMDWRNELSPSRESRNASTLIYKQESTATFFTWKQVEGRVWRMNYTAIVSATAA